MEIFKSYKSTVVPTCLKEGIERKSQLSKSARLVSDRSLNHVSEFDSDPEESTPNSPIRTNPNPTQNPNQNPTQNPTQNPNPIPAPNQMRRPIQLNTPYPELVDVLPNRADIRQLKMLATGRDSELSAILTYLYQHFILLSDYPEISRELERVAEVEMRHYSLLSKAIVAFGGDPNITNGIGDVWTGRNVNTQKNVRRILQDNIKAEKSAINNYQRAARETNNESLAKLYLRIAEDEALHKTLFENLLASLV